MPKLFPMKAKGQKKNPAHLLTKNVVRLLNFGPINKKIKPKPIHFPKPEDIMIILGKWKHLIIFDLYNGYFQNHMALEDLQCRKQ